MKSVAKQFANMSSFKFALLGLVHFLTTLALGSKCPQDAISKLVVCYYEGRTPLSDFDICNCTHVVFTNAVTRSETNAIDINEDAVKYIRLIKEKKENLSALFTLNTKDDISKILKSENRSEELVNAISNFLQESRFDGVEINFHFRSNSGVSKEHFTSFVKSLSKTLSSHHRVKRDGYDVFEKIDDITTASYTTQTPKNSTSKTQSIKDRNKKRKDSSSRRVREESEEEPDDRDYLTLEEAVNAEFSDSTSEKENTLKDVDPAFTEKKLELFVRLPLTPETIAKKYDLKALSKYVDVLVVPTHDITSSSEEHLTYHPSRLMGLADILNTDSILDFLTGMGGLKSKMVISIPATVLKFELKDENKNTPRAPTRSKPTVIDQAQLCSLFSKSNWTVERDDDLTAPYAFSGKNWLAFEDEISINIKGKYILLRELAGGAIYPIDADLSNGLCANRSGSNGYLTGILHKNFESLERKPRALVLESLQEEIHDTAYTNIEAGVKLSEYRIVRVVDHTGAVHVIRKNTKTQFECSRQGYFSHPLGCNKFYRCVKFDQYSDEFTVFEYDCPAGLAFDERWEVCVWPGSLPHGAPCTGSSEIAPVPRSHYRCPNQEGYYADPENCRWFFACLDHARDGITPLTAYEFRCPFGLVFSAEKLACDWPWLVGSCGNAGAAGFVRVSSGAQSQGIHSATFINGGNLEASLGQYGNTEQEDSFANFGHKFGSVLKGAEYNVQGAYQSAQTAGFGYIASNINDNYNRAAFATFPEHDISGGRIYNKGGVVLHQNVAGVSGNAEAGAGVNAIGIVRGSGRNFGKSSGLFNQETVQSVGGFNSGADITLHELKPSPKIITANNVEISGHLQQQNVISTPKPFSVSIPSVQINSEFSGHSSSGVTTSHTVSSPSTENFSVHQQFSTPQGFSPTQATVSVNVPVVTAPTPIHTLQEDLTHSSLLTKQPVQISTSSVSFSTTPRTETHRFGQSVDFLAGRPFQQNELHSGGVASGATVGVEAQSFGYSLGSEAVSTPATVSVPIVTPKPAVHTFEYTSSGRNFYKTVTPTETPVVGFKEQQSSVGTGIGKSTISVQIPEIQTHIFEGADQSLFSKSAAVGQIGGSYGAPPTAVTKPVQGEVHTGVRFSTVSSKPQFTLDAKISDELRLNTPQSSSVVSSVTPKIELFSTPKLQFSQTGQSTFGSKTTAGATVFYGAPTVTPAVDLKLDGVHISNEGVSPAVPVSFSGLSGATGNSFIQNGVSKEFSKVSYNIPAVTSQNAFGYGSISQTGRTSFVPVLKSEVKTENIGGEKISHSFPRPVVPQQSAFDQKYSFGYSGSNFGSTAAISSTSIPLTLKTELNPLPKIQHTEVSVEQQPIVSVGTISTVSFDQTVSTPQPVVNNANFKANYNEQTFVTTPAPPVSITPSVSVTYNPPPHSVNIFGKSAQSKTLQQTPESIRIETSGPAFHETLVNVPDVTFSEKSSNLQQEFKSFAPVAVTTSAPPVYNDLTGVTGKSNLYVKNRAYLPPVTPKIEVFGTSAQQKPINLLNVGSVAQQQPVVHQSFEFFGSSPSIQEKQTPFTEVNAVVPEQHLSVVSTGKPFTSQEKLVNLEITKSVEISPSEFFQTSGGYQNTFGKSIEIQQQPLHLLSQKTLPAKQVIQPFYKQEKEITGKQQQQFAFQQPVNIKTEFVQQNQYLPPAVTVKPNLPPQLSTVAYSTPKTVELQQPIDYTEKVESDVPVLPVFEPSKVPIVSQKESSRTSFGGYLPPVLKSSIQTNVRSQEVSSPKANLLLPTTTAFPEFISPQTEQLNFQKVNNQNIFRQSEIQLKPSVSVFGSSGHLAKATGGSVVESEIKYGINPNIAIPEPPHEYVLAENGFTTAAPELSSTFRAQTTSSGSEFKGSTYLPPVVTTRTKPTKTTLISVGNIDEEDVRGDNVQQLFDKYSGRFGEVIGNRNGKVVTKIVKGNGKGTIEVNGQGSSTVQYEISSTTQRPISRGRQYHGGITSGIQATNKYEEYEIDNDGQRSLSQDTGKSSKTTLDLKNLKLDNNKKTVIVVSQVSDANPILVGKLAGQCSCQSNMLEIRTKGKQSSRRKNTNSRQRVNISNKYLPPYEGNDATVTLETLRQADASTAAPRTVLIDDSKSFGITQTTEQTYISSSTTAHPNLVSSTILSSLGPDGVLSITPKTVYTDDSKIRFKKKQFRGRTRYLPPSSGLPEDGSSVPSVVPASEIASTIDYSVLRGDESRTQNEIDGFGAAKAGAGAAFDRYGPGGWRGFDEVLQGSVDCKRPGLFRHPKYCNKFYACNYDPWKERYTLHVFNCPIHLTYDSSISACNWPVRGPACADDNLLV